MFIIIMRRLVCKQCIDIFTCTFLCPLRSIVSYSTTTIPLYSVGTISQADNINQYDSIDEDVLRNYQEFSLASLIFFAMKESACSEQSARMTAMESATKNAGTCHVLANSHIFNSSLFYIWLDRKRIYLLKQAYVEDVNVLKIEFHPNRLIYINVFGNLKKKYPSTS